jgi:transcriptional regulator with XRE-family HTH domain
MEYRDIHDFKRCYKYLVEEMGRTQKSICEETGLQPATVMKIIRSKNGDKMNIQASTLASVQDFNEAYREEAEAFKPKKPMSPQEVEEFAQELEEEGYLGRKKPPTISEEKDVMLKTLDECDAFDLLKVLWLRHSDEVTININLKKSEP